MTHKAAPLDDCPPLTAGGQLSFCSINDDAWTTWLISCVSRGDLIQIERDGDLVIYPALDRPVRLDT